MRPIWLLPLPLFACVVNSIPIADEGDEGSTTAPIDDTTTTDPPPSLPSTTAPGDGSTAMTTVPDDTSGGSSDDGGGTGGLGEECTLELQDCMEGLKCMPYNNKGGSWWNAVACFPVDPDPVGVGEPCSYYEHTLSGYDNCGHGEFCWPTNEDGTGVCKDLCDAADPDDIWDSLYCENPGATPYIGCQDCFCVCEVACDPLAQDCGEGQGCYLTGYNFFLCGPDASEGMGQHGESCEYVNHCAPGTACISAEAIPGCEGFGCCSDFCDIDAPNTCPGADLGETCVALFEDPADAPVGLDHIGLCAVI